MFLVLYAVWFLACHSEFSNAAWLQLSDLRLGFGSSFSSFVLLYYYIISLLEYARCFINQ